MRSASMAQLPKYMSNRPLSAQKWTENEETKYQDYRKTMKSRLSSMTAESAWDKIMQGAFLKVFNKTP